MTIWFDLITGIPYTALPTDQAIYSAPQLYPDWGNKITVYYNEKAQHWRIWVTGIREKSTSKGYTFRTSDQIQWILPIPEALQNRALANQVYRKLAELPNRVENELGTISFFYERKPTT